MNFRRKRKERGFLQNRILADTSVWIEFFKSVSDTGDMLASLLAQNTVCTCGIVLFELMQGIKSEEEKAAILSILSELTYFEMPAALWQEAAGLSQMLKKKGLALPLSDIFIASIAIEHNLSIFTLDKHFEQIPGVNIYRP